MWDVSFRRNNLIVMEFLVVDNIELKSQHMFVGLSNVR